MLENIIYLDRVEKGEEASSPPYPMPVFLTIKQLADLLQIPVKTVYRLVENKQIPGRKWGREYRFLLEDILKWHREGNVVVTGPGKEVQESGHQTTKRIQNVLHRHQIHGQEREKAALPQVNWTKRHQERSRKTGEGIESDAGTGGV